MATASRSLATALLGGALRERLAPPSYTTSRDTTLALRAPGLWKNDKWTGGGRFAAFVSGGEIPFPGNGSPGQNGRRVPAIYPRRETAEVDHSQIALQPACTFEQRNLVGHHHNGREGRGEQAADP